MPVKTFVVCCLVLLIPVMGFERTGGQNSSITGKWVSEKDPDSKWVFTRDGQCTRYHKNEVLGTFTYTISTDTLPCGKTVKLIKNVSFLSLKDQSDVHEYCYYLEGLTDKRMTLNPFGSGKFFTYRRQ